VKIIFALLFVAVAAVVATGLFSSPRAGFPVVSPTPSTTPAASSGYFYPISNYPQRLTLRLFGQLVKPADAQKVPCGQSFSGFHTGDDLEVLPSEIDQPVPVYSIAQGQVIEAVDLSGYGGVLVIAYDLDGQPVTAYYGHINLGSVTRLAGQDVTPGQQLAQLGDACSAQTGGERKHLHFALHKGKGIDYRGYVGSESQLSFWLDPSVVLSRLKAATP
jgi:murein DD-endopeptidase MepM/ murein hydrolase activator NlpD